MRNERGSITLWMVGMVLVVFLVGGIAIDLWRGLAAHQRLAAVVDAAAVAAGSGIDETTWREQGLLRLDPVRVQERLALAAGAQGTPAMTLDVVTAADGSSAVVSGSASVELTLLRLVVDDSLELSATATASPALVP